MAWHGGTAMPRHRAEKIFSAMPRPATEFIKIRHVADFRHSIFRPPWRFSATAFSNRHGGFPPQHFQTAMADFRHGIFRPPSRISATAFSNRHRGFPPQYFQIARADFRHTIFRPPQHFYFNFQN